jgi:CubicO group peptidase (beta-lactamase class C family)
MGRQVRGWIACLSAILVAGACVPLEEQEALNRGWSDARIDSLVSSMPALMSDHGVPGAAIALTFRDSVQWAAGFGVTGPAGDPVRTETVFQVASLGKPVFAHLLEKLEVERDWTFADPIEAWSRPGDLPSEWLALTAEALLSHTSGLRFDPELDQVILDPMGQGTWSYSGAGYVLLQRALEAAEGRGLDEIAFSEMFEPWGLTSMSFVEPESGEVATGHARSGAALENLGWPEPNAASSLYSNVLDYARFMVGVAGGEGDEPRAWSRLTLRRALVSDDLGLYWGAGWALEDQASGSVAAFHWGSNPGFKSFALVDKARAMGLVILTNGDFGLELVEHVVAILDEQSHPLFGFFMLHPDD